VDVGLVIPNPQSMPKKDIIHHKKFSGFRLYPRDEIVIQWIQVSPEKGDVDINDRSLKEKVIPVFNPMNHSPSIVHDGPHHHLM
jgi:hypothetical protein